MLKVLYDMSSMSRSEHTTCTCMAVFPSQPHSNNGGVYIEAAAKIENLLAKSLVAKSEARAKQHHSLQNPQHRQGSIHDCPLDKIYTGMCTGLTSHVT